VEQSHLNARKLQNLVNEGFALSFHIMKISINISRLVIVYPGLKISSMSTVKTKPAIGLIGDASVDGKKVLVVKGSLTGQMHVSTQMA